MNRITSGRDISRFRTPTPLLNDTSSMSENEVHWYTKKWHATHGYPMAPNHLSRHHWWQLQVQPLPNSIPLLLSAQSATCETAMKQSMVLGCASHLGSVIYNPYLIPVLPSSGDIPYIIGGYSPFTKWDAPPSISVSMTFTVAVHKNTMVCSWSQNASSVLYGKKWRCRFVMGAPPVIIHL